MKNILFSGALASGLLASSAMAAELTGGYIDLGYSSYTDTDVGSRLFAAGSAELAFSRQFSIQGDLAGYQFNELSETGTAFTLHTNFHVNEGVSLGAFYNRDSLNVLDIDSFGLEAGFETGAVELEGYISQFSVQNVDFDGTQIGAKIGGDVSEKVGLSAAIDYVSSDFDIDGTYLKVGADYDLGSGAKVYGEVGSARTSIGSLSGTEPFVGVGLRVNFGAARGTTFGRRGLLDKEPGL